MAGLDTWDWVIVGGAAVIAVASLVKLMRARRDLLVAQVQAQMAAEQERRRKEEKKRKKREREEARRAG